MKNETTKRLNKRILRKRAEFKKGKIALIVFFIVITSPIWLYTGIIHGIILPSFGEKTKGILTGLRKPSSWNQYHRYDAPSYYCTFDINDEIYENNSTISAKDTSFHLGDTVAVIYLKNLPFINAIILPKDTN